MKTIMPNMLRQWMQEGRSFVLVDVREDFEREAYSIGGLHLPMSELVQRWQELPKDQTLVLYCEKGIRSAIAIQRLEGGGLGPLYNLEGGMKGWKQTEIP